LDIPPTTKDLLPLLGLFPSLCRGPPHDNQQIQHRVTASAHRGHHRHAFGHNRRDPGHDGSTVSFAKIFLFGEEKLFFFPPGIVPAFDGGERAMMMLMLTTHVIRYLVATTTIWSGASYIYTKDAVKILNQDKSKEEKPDGCAKR
jgi:hypothetical protein